MAGLYLIQDTTLKGIADVYRSYADMGADYTPTDLADKILLLPTQIVERVDRQVEEEKRYCVPYLIQQQHSPLETYNDVKLYDRSISGSILGFDYDAYNWVTINKPTSNQGNSQSCSIYNYNPRYGLVVHVQAYYTNQLGSGTYNEYVTIAPDSTENFAFVNPSSQMGVVSTWSISVESFGFYPILI